MFLTIGNQQLFLNYAACGLQEARCKVKIKWRVAIDWINFNIF
jgi:hypothetical protein